MVATSTKIRVKLDKNFMTGRRGPSNDAFFIDYKQMTKEQQRTLKVLVKQVLNAYDHEGRNKPSYTDKRGQPLRDAGFYRKRHYWHYHSGTWLPTPHNTLIYASNSPHHRPAKNLDINYLGKVSNPCIHYVWVNPQTVKIVAYTEVHEPFLLAAAWNNSQRARQV